MKDITLISKKPYYKPFKYPWAFEAFDKSEKMHWLPSEVPLDQDVRDWKEKLTQGERDLLTQLFRFFTQGDIDVANGYINKYLPVFGGNVEVAMMMCSFAAREAVHIQAYSLLLDTIGMNESEYAAFHNYKEMLDKHEYLHNFDITYNHYNAEQGCMEPYPMDVAKALAVYSAFTEGLMLFSSFAILLNFSRFNKMKGMCTIVDWSVKDESLHVESMIKLFKTYVAENAEKIDHPQLIKDLHEICGQMVKLEDAFIDLAFGVSEIEGLKKEDVKTYIRYLANRRMDQLGLGPHYTYIKGNPLPWLDWILNGTEHTNFFEGRVTDYSKGNMQGEITEW